MFTVCCKSGGRRKFITSEYLYICWLFLWINIFFLNIFKGKSLNLSFTTETLKTDSSNIKLQFKLLSTQYFLYFIFICLIFELKL